MSNMKRFGLSAALLGLMAVTNPARADFIGDTVTITADSSFSGDPQTIDVIVADGAELPAGFGTSAGLGFQTGIDILADAVQIDIVSFMGIAGRPFQGLRFTSLDSPGEKIVGFTVQSTIGGDAGTFLASAVTFGDNFLNIDLQNDPAVGQSYQRGDQILVTLQFGPTSAVPEPASMAMLGMGGLALVGYARRRKAKATA
jgi:hypothetical protein